MALSGWDEKDEDLLFARDTSSSGQFEQKWKLWMMAQEAGPKQAANSKLRRMLAYKKTFNCTAVQIGDSVLFYKAANRKSTP